MSNKQHYEKEAKECKSLGDRAYDEGRHEDACRLWDIARDNERAAESLLYRWFGW